MTPAGDEARVVLVVEDEPAIRLLCRASLQRAAGVVGQARVVEAADLATARGLAATERPDVIVMDVQLPDGSGLDLARELRDGKTGGRPRVIVASASVLPAQREAAMAIGADVFLPKPYRPDELVAAVARLLDEQT